MQRAYSAEHEGERDTNQPSPKPTRARVPVVTAYISSFAKPVAASHDNYARPSLEWFQVNH